MQRAQEREELPWREVAAFLASMPQRYQREFDWTTAQEHAAIARARGGRAAHAALFDDVEASRSALCVVAPDAPGLLASICASLMLERFDITRAEAFTRHLPDGMHEAVDQRHQQPDKVG